MGKEGGTGALGASGGIKPLLQKSGRRRPQVCCVGTAPKHLTAHCGLKLQEYTERNCTQC